MGCQEHSYRRRQQSPGRVPVSGGVCPEEGGGGYHRAGILCAAFLRARGVQWRVSRQPHPENAGRDYQFYCDKTISFYI